MRMTSWPNGLSAHEVQARFLELLRLRYSSPLLRLPRAEHIQRQVRFLNTGPQQARLAGLRISLRPYLSGHWGVLGGAV